MTDDARDPRTDAGAYYRELLRPLFEKRRFILIGGPVAGLRGLCNAVRQLGAEKPFLLGTSLGTGSLPNEGGPPYHSAGIRAANVIESMRAYEAWLEDVPDEVRRALDRYDPEHEARALGLIIMGPIEAVAGRPLYARRAPLWAELEDKVVIDGFWDGIGVPRAPSKVVRSDGAALRGAAWCLDRGDGTVWAGDAREGTNGGGVFVRWVKDESDANNAERFFTSHCDRVRVMPFLDGIPCSIHGIVFPDGVSVFRPVEGIVLRRGDRTELCYAGMATYWDPPDADREAIRELARHTGTALREQLGYRGPFTIDGVLTPEGFRPTELNARFGAGTAQIAASAPDIPVSLICLAALAGEPLDFQPQRLEAAVLAAADATRAGGGWTSTPEQREDTRELSLVYDGAGYRLAREGEVPGGTLSVGPGDMGGFLRFAPDPAHTPVGPSLAPRVAQAFACADRELGLDLGPLEPAREVR